MTGINVRSLYVQGRGALAQFAVHQDATGRARSTTLALCKAIGLTRGGVFESSFREEAELDLFAEQVVWAGITAWFLECFEIGVEQGFSPVLMVMELYASGETAEIFAAMTRNRSGGSCCLMDSSVVRRPSGAVRMRLARRCTQALALVATTVP